WLVRLSRAFGDVADIVKDVAFNFQQFRQRGVDPVVSGMLALGAVFPGLRSVLQPIIGVVQSLTTAFRAFFEGDWAGGFSALGDAASHAWDAIMAAFEMGVESLLNAIEEIDWGAIWDGLRDTASTLNDRLNDVASALFDWFTSTVSGIDWAG